MAQNGTTGLPDLLEGLPSRIHEVYSPFVERTPAHPAFIEAGRTWTYRQFAEAVDAVTGNLSKMSIRPGDRLIVASENSVAMAAMLFAASKLDVWAIPVNPRLSVREFGLITEHSGARRILLNAALSREAADHAARLGADTVSVGPFGGIGITTLNDEVLPEAVCADRAKQVAALMYTSGTTGAPKGVMLTHQNLLVAARSAGRLHDTGPSDCGYGVLPMSHIIGYAVVLIATLMHGATLQVVSKADPASLAQAIGRGEITTLFGVPVTYQRLLQHKTTAGLERLERGRLRLMAVAGAPLDVGLKQRIEAEFGIPLLNNYGITECSPGLSGVRQDGVAHDETVGRLFPGVEHRIIDRQGEPVQVGEIGELHVRGKNVMLGYYRAPELTAAAVDGEGWFNTGDLARISSGGELYIAGRTKELIVRSGFNVYPAEVEAVLNAHEQVAQSAVVARPVTGNEEIVAFVQLLPGALASAADIESYAASQLTSYKRPCEIVILDTLPVTSSGKILKSRLREMAVTGSKGLV